MFRHVTPFLAAALLPIATLLVILGVRVLRIDKRTGLGLKFALILNTSLAIALGWVGSAQGKENETMENCYLILEIPDESVPDEFSQSDGWHDLEQAVIDLEYEITSGDFGDGKYGELSDRISKAKLELAGEGILGADELEVIGAYCSERLAWYLHVVGGATCYKPMPAPTGREETLGNAVARAMELRKLYADYSFTSESYVVALAALENHLREYTGDEDVSTVRQLILDLADGVKYD